MRTVFKSMQMEKYGIPKDVLPKFESIIKKYYVPNSGSREGDNKFKEAMKIILRLETEDDHYKTISCLHS